MKTWQQAVRKRDKNKCQICGSKTRIHVHHIKRFADAPSLRYNVSNGICLCKKCHERVTGKEEAYAPLLIRKVYFNKTGEHLRQDLEEELECIEVTDDPSCILPISESIGSLEDYDED